MHTSAVVLLTPINLRSLLPHPVGPMLAGTSAPAGPGPPAVQELLLSLYLLLTSWHILPVTGSNLSGCSVLLGSPSQPSLKDRETLFCRSEISANCLVTADSGAYLLSRAGLSPPGKAP